MYKSFKAAFRGIYLAFSKERNLKIQLLIAIITVAYALKLELARFQMSLIWLCVGLVLGSELVNTAIEKLCNKITMEHDEQIKDIKDIAAGAVLLCSIIAAIVAAYVFLPHILAQLN